MTTHTPPPTLAADLRRLTVLELSLPARMGYIALLLAASTMTVIVTALLLTEEGLPRRASIALAVMAVIGLSWMAFAALGADPQANPPGQATSRGEPPGARVQQRVRRRRPARWLSDRECLGAFGGRDSAC